VDVKFFDSLLIASLVGVVAQPAFAHHELDESSFHGHSKAVSSKPAEDPWHLLDFALTPAFALTTNVRIFFEGPYRVIDSNGIPNHQTGQFPNAGNPNSISAQDYDFRMPKEPSFAQSPTPMFMEPFGVAINGIPFDPGANEFWQGDRNSGWQYEPMFNHSLGLDQSNAHVQPNGAYHYHGLPTGLLEKLAQSPRPVLIGYAADGFPIYAPFGYKDPKNIKSGMTKLRSSYRLKGGTRPSGPGGNYDGSFVQDYEYVASLGDLDQHNGRFGLTTEYPQGIYHYIVTDNFPFIPRSWKGTPDESFKRHGHTGRGGRGGNGQRPDGQRGFSSPGGTGRDGQPDGVMNGRPPGGPPAGGPWRGGPPGGPGGFPRGGPWQGGPAGGGQQQGGPPGGGQGRFPGGGPQQGGPPGSGPQQGGPPGDSN
jgi:hypothetical protein